MRKRRKHGIRRRNNMGRGIVGQKTFQASGFARQHRQNLARRGSDTRRDERLLELDGRSIQQKTCRKIVHRIDQQIKMFGHVGVAFIKSTGYRLDIGIGIRREQGFLGCFHFKPAATRIVFREKRLPVQIGELHLIGINDRDAAAIAANAGPHEEIGHGSAQCPTTDDEYPTPLQTLLALFAERRKIRVTFKTCWHHPVGNNKSLFEKALSIIS